MAEKAQAAKANGEFEKQYDRQIRLWGLAAQQRMANASVLVIGLRGLAAEICKNLVLAGQNTCSPSFCGRGTVADELAVI